MMEPNKVLDKLKSLVADIEEHLERNQIQSDHNDDAEVAKATLVLDELNTKFGLISHEVHQYKRHVIL